MTTIQEEILSQVRAFMADHFTNRYEIYDLSLKTVNKNRVLQVFIDSPKGVTIDDCETVSRSLGKYLDQTDPIHCKYTLEVSSPGIERLLKRTVDFERHLGKMVRWVLSSSNSETPKEVFKGRLQEFAPHRILVISEKGLREFPLSEVIEARAVLEFPKKPRG